MISATPANAPTRIQYGSPIAQKASEARPPRARSARPVRGRTHRAWRRSAPRCPAPASVSAAAAAGRAGSRPGRSKIQWSAREHEEDPERDLEDGQRHLDGRVDHRSPREVIERRWAARMSCLIPVDWRSPVEAGSRAGRRARCRPGRSRAHDEPEEAADQPDEDDVVERDPDASRILWRASASTVGRIAAARMKAKKSRRRATSAATTPAPARRSRRRRGWRARPAWLFPSSRQRSRRARSPSVSSLRSGVEVGDPQVPNPTGCVARRRHYPVPRIARPTGDCWRSKPSARFDSPEPTRTYSSLVLSSRSSSTMCEPSETTALGGSARSRGEARCRRASRPSSCRYRCVPRPARNSSGSSCCLVSGASSYSRSVFNALQACPDGAAGRRGDLTRGAETWRRRPHPPGRTYVRALEMLAQWPPTSCRPRGARAQPQGHRRPAAAGTPSSASPGCPDRASRRSPSTPSMPRASAATSRASPGAPVPANDGEARRPTRSTGSPAISIDRRRPRATRARRSAP